jgi:hypothetical protein
VEILDVRLGMPAIGQHMVTSRAFDADGNVQPAPDDPFLASKATLLGEQWTDHTPGSHSLIICEAVQYCM